MTALGADVSRIEDSVERRLIGLAASKTVYANGMACFDTSGYLDAATDTALFRFAGVFEQGGVAPSTAGALKLPVQRRGIFKFATVSQLDASHIGCPVCVKDDNTVQLPWESTNQVYCGKVVEFGTLVAFIEIDEAVAGRIQCRQARGVIMKTAASLAHSMGAIYRVPKGKKARVMNLKCFIEVIPNFDTSVMVVSNRDASAGADVNLLVAANIDLETMVAKAITPLSLTATVANLLLDEDDAIFGVVTEGANLVTAGEGITLLAEICEW